MSMRNERRLSTNADNPDRRRSSSRGAVGGIRAGASGGGTEPKIFDRWYFMPEKVAPTANSVNELAMLAIAATEFRDYMAEQYGVAMTMDDASDFLERYGSNPDLEDTTQE